jgi:hypothetical protein|uniref:hypothetical protein n=1 Tax=Prosthecobacter sp. TaxID=1965333 RepID=UPI0037838CF0
MESNNRPLISQSRRWWCLWLLATVILPAAAGVVYPFMALAAMSEVWALVALIILVLHLATSTKLDDRGSGWAAGLLILGGWIMIPTSFFLGCAAFVGVHSR